MHFTIDIRVDGMDQIRGLDNVTHGIIEQNPTQKLQRVKLFTIKQQERRMESTVHININQK